MDMYFETEGFQYKGVVHVTSKQLSLTFENVYWLNPVSIPIFILMSAAWLYHNYNYSKIEYRIKYNFTPFATNPVYIQFIIHTSPPRKNTEKKQTFFLKKDWLYIYWQHKCKVYEKSYLRQCTPNQKSWTKKSCLLGIQFHCMSLMNL